MLVLKLKSMKDLLRFTRFLSEKTSRKWPLYRHGERVYMIFRRKLADQKIIAVIAETKIRSKKLQDKTVLAYNYHRDRIVLRSDTSDTVGAWKTLIINSPLDIESNMGSTPIELPANVDMKNFYPLRLIPIDSWKDLILLAFFARDLILRMKAADNTLLLTGICSRLFIPADPSLTLFYTRIDHTEIDNEAHYAEIGDDIRFTKRVSIRTTRFVPIIDTQRMEVYGDKP